MALKRASEINAQKYANQFRLVGDGDSADVIFLYRSTEDVMFADVHYLKSDDYSGFVDCLEKGCPACEKGIRKDTELFVPLYNVTTGQIEVWDRSTRFEAALHEQVFSKYPNPSEYVFTIVRNGSAGDRNTRYTIQVAGRNTIKSYDQILQDAGMDIIGVYRLITKELPASEITKILSSRQEPNKLNGSGSGAMHDYQPSPRVAPPSASSMTPPQNVAPPPVDDTVADGSSDEDYEDFGADEDVTF